LTSLCLNCFWIWIWQKEPFMIVHDCWLIRKLVVVVLLKTNLRVKDWSLNNWLHLHLLLPLRVLNFDGIGGWMLITFFLWLSYNLASLFFLHFLLVFDYWVHFWTHLSFDWLTITYISISHIILFLWQYLKFAFTFFRMRHFLFSSMHGLLLSFSTTGDISTCFVFFLAIGMHIFDREWARTKSVAFSFDVELMHWLRFPKFFMGIAMSTIISPDFLFQNV